MIRAMSYLVITFLVAPIFFVVWVSFTPNTGFSLTFAAPSLQWYKRLLADGDFINSFATSVTLGTAVTAASLFLGTMAAYSLSTFRIPFASAIKGILAAPLMIPGVAFGIGLTQLFAGMGLTSGFTTLFIGHLLFTTPFVMRAVGASLSVVDRNVERAAIDLGASPFRAFITVTVPMLRSGMIAGGFFAFLNSFDELTISLFLSGLSIVPLPVRVFTYIDTVMEPTVAAASVFLIITSIIFMVVVERAVGLDRIMTGRARQR